MGLAICVRLEAYLILLLKKKDLKVAKKLNPNIYV